MRASLDDQEELLIDYHVAAFWMSFGPVVKRLGDAVTCTTSQGNLQVLSNSLKSKQLARTMVDVVDVGFDNILSSQALGEHKQRVMGFRTLASKAESCFEAMTIDDEKCSFSVHDETHTDLINALLLEDLGSFSNRFLDAASVAKPVDACMPMFHVAQSSAVNSLQAMVSEDLKPCAQLVAKHLAANSKKGGKPFVRFAWPQTKEMPVFKAIIGLSMNQQVSKMVRFASIVDLVGEEPPALKKIGGVRGASLLPNIASLAVSLRKALGSTKPQGVASVPKILELLKQAEADRSSFMANLCCESASNDNEAEHSMTCELQHLETDLRNAAAIFLTDIVAIGSSKIVECVRAASHEDLAVDGALDSDASGDFDPSAALSITNTAASKTLMCAWMDLSQWVTLPASTASSLMAIFPNFEGAVYSEVDVERMSVVASKAASMAVIQSMYRSRCCKRVATRGFCAGRLSIPPRLCQRSSP